MFYDTFSSLCKKIGKSPSKVALECDISKSAVSTWKSGRSNPQTEQLKKIADYFNVSVDYLLTGEEAEQKNKPSAQGEGLTEERIKLNKKLTALSQENVNVVLEHVEFLLHKQKQENKQKQ